MELPSTITVIEVYDQTWVMYMHKTTASQKDPEKLIDKQIAYVLQARRLLVKFSYSDSDIIAMDETAIW